MSAENAGSRSFEGSATGRKAQILDAALDVFAEKGYEGGSMREIASRVGVTEPALYRHFSGKEALFLALLRLGAGNLQRETVRVLETISPADLRPQLLAILADRRRAFTRYAPLLRIILPAAARNDRFLAEYRTAIVEPVRATLSAKAAEIDVALGVPDADVTRDARVRALIALVVGFIASSFVLADEADPAIADAILRVMQWEPARR